MILYRPVGLAELRLIAHAGFRAFPPSPAISSDTARADKLRAIAARDVSSSPLQNAP